MCNHYITIFIVVSLTFFTLPACKTTQPALLEQQLAQEVEKGMSSEQVRAIMGEPKRIDKRNGEVVWMVYGKEDRRYLIYFEEKKVKSLPLRQNGSSDAITSWAFQ